VAAASAHRALSLPACYGDGCRGSARFMTRITVCACHFAPFGVEMPRAVNCAAICRADKPVLFNSARTGARAVVGEGTFIRINGEVMAIWK